MIGPRWIGVVVVFGVLAAFFGWMESRWPSSPRPASRRGKWLDVSYWLFMAPIVTKGLERAAIVVAVIILAIIAQRPLEREAILAGFGPLSRQPFWLQAIEVLLMGDFIGYWMHRLFHGPRLWKFHAVHHSSDHVDWLAAARVHPINDILTRLVQLVPLFLLGFKPLVLAAYAPFLTLHAIFLHANVPWTFGPLRYVISSPTFHRWHHTKEAEGRDKNFAGFFPVWDLMFGTFFMPPGRQPMDFGVDDPMPETLWGQMTYPFRRTSQPTKAPPTVG